jgi:hypothetical protein
MMILKTLACSLPIMAKSCGIPVDGSAGKSLSQVFEGCAEVPLDVVGSVYPRFNNAAGKVISLEQVINMCRETYNGCKAL